MVTAEGQASLLLRVIRVISSGTEVSFRPNPDLADVRRTVGLLRRTCFRRVPRGNQGEKRLSGDIAVLAVELRASTAIPLTVSSLPQRSHTPRYSSQPIRGCWIGKAMLGGRMPRYDFGPTMSASATQ